MTYKLRALCSWIVFLYSYTRLNWDNVCLLIIIPFLVIFAIHFTMYWHFVILKDNVCCVSLCNVQVYLVIICIKMENRSSTLSQMVLWIRYVQGGLLELLFCESIAVRLLSFFCNHAISNSPLFWIWWRLFYLWKSSLDMLINSGMGWMEHSYLPF